MRAPGATRPAVGPARRGLTLVEAVVSMVIVSVMLVAALNTVGSSPTSQRRTSERSRGVLLARQLMAEILQQSYEEPEDVPDSGGSIIVQVGSSEKTILVGADLGKAVVQ